MDLSNVLTAVLSGLTVNISLALGGVSSPGVAVSVNDVTVNQESVVPALHLFGTELLALNGKAFEWFYPVKVNELMKTKRPVPTNDYIWVYERYWVRYIGALQRRAWLIMRLGLLTGQDGEMSDEDVVKELRGVVRWQEADRVFGETYYGSLRRVVLERLWREELRYLDSELIMLEAWLRMYISYFIVPDGSESEVQDAFVDEFRYRVRCMGQ